MTRFIGRLALYVLVSISVAGMARAQTQEALEEALEAGQVREGPTGGKRR